MSLNNFMENFATLHLYFDFLNGKFTPLTLFELQFVVILKQFTNILLLQVYK